MVTFNYTGSDENGTDVSKSLTVPILTMLPIPNLEVCICTAADAISVRVITLALYRRRASQIEEATVEFNAKISSVTSSSTEQNTAYGVTVNAKYSSFWSPVSVDLKASFSSTKQTKSSNVENREYSMRVLVRARQASIPEGLKRILDILEEAMKVKS
jgi:hypothetical protein